MMLLAVLQANAAVLDVEANLRTIEDAARRAAEAGARLLLTPELFPVGYAPLRVRAELDPGDLHGLRAKLQDIARRHGIGLVHSLPVVTADGRWHIGATLLDTDGSVLMEYVKVHLFGEEERKAFVAGTRPPAVVDFHGIKASLLICFDVEFPEAVRAAATHGAQLLLVPTALSHGFDSVPQVLVRARALESQLHVAYANHSGIEDGCTFLGGSVVAGPDGVLEASAGPAAELLFADVSVQAVDDARAVVPYLGERRPEVYREWGLCGA
jgi:5-aminopentanamidase